jgi:hypothetical protein
MNLTEQGKSGLVYVSAVADDLREQAGILLWQLASQEPEPDRNGNVRLDWGVVKLVRHGNEVRVEEPDYKHDARRFVPGLNFTAAVLRAQQSVHDRLWVSPEPVKYDQNILVYARDLKPPELAAIRQKTEREGDTGWRLFDAVHIDWSAEPRALRVYEIARERPALMAVLSLPAGWSVRLQDGNLAEVAPPEGEPRTVGMPLEL